MKSIAVSVRTKLLKISKEAGRDFDAVLLQFMQERLLYRLSLSKHKDKFILKGALLFLAYNMSRLRPTKDMDFLSLQASQDKEKLRGFFEEILTITAEDGVDFKSKTLRIENIIEEDDPYSPFRIKIEAELAGARKILQVDVGFGDIIVAGPIELNFPVLLDFPAPKIMTYSHESVIAEKFEAIVSLNFLTSRLKDFYDISFLAKTIPFKSMSLHEALLATFQKRGTNLENYSVVFSDKFKKDKDKVVQWTAFLKRNKIEDSRIFEEVVLQIESFLL